MPSTSPPTLIPADNFKTIDYQDKVGLNIDKLQHNIIHGKFYDAGSD